MSEEPETTVVADPFDQRPTLIFRATETEKTTWGAFTALGITAVCLCVSYGLVELNRHNLGAMAGGFMAAAVFIALTRHAMKNPPASVGLNVENRRYKVVRGAGRFRQVHEGAFDDVECVGTFVEESSHGIDGYKVAIVFTGKIGRCDVEKHGPGAQAKAEARAAQLAGILGVAYRK